MAAHVVRIALWSLADADATVDDVRAEELPPTPGSLFEAWFSDEATDRFGAVAIFPNAEAAEAPPPERLRELLGKAPDVVEVFDLESPL